MIPIAGQRGGESWQAKEFQIFGDKARRVANNDVAAALYGGT
jgi:hypothetical protein